MIFQISKINPIFYIWSRLYTFIRLWTSNIIPDKYINWISVNMLINEDYFNDLEIEDKDIIEDDNLDVDGPVDFKTY